MTSDDRMTWGLIIDVIDVLERHGYHRCDNRHTGQAVGVIFDLAHVYDGTHEGLYGTDPHLAQPAPPPEPAASDHDADDAVILTGAEASTIAAALDIAADSKRDRAAACADCANQTCLTCQTRLRDAQAYEQMATQLWHTAQAARAANSSQLEPDRPPPPPRSPHLAADKEAGQ